MLANARTQAADLAGTPLAEPANHVVELLQVAGSQLRLDVGTLSADAKAELALIAAHDRITRSPILGTDIDYSLYTPRGHYTQDQGADPLLPRDVRPGPDRVRAPRRAPGRPAAGRTRPGCARRRSRPARSSGTPRW